MSPPDRLFSSSRLDRLFVALLAAMPAIMVVSTRSSPLVLMLAAVVGLAARWRGEGLAILARDGTRWLATPLSALVLAALMLAGLSLLWTPDPAFAGGYLAQLAGNAVLIPLVLLVAPAVDRRFAGRALAVGIGVASVLLLVELLTGGAILTALGQKPSGPYRVNRVVVTVVVLTPIMAAFLLPARMWVAAVALTVLVAVMAVVSSSGAAVMGLACGLLALALAWKAPFVMVRVAGVGAICASLAMPMLARHVNDAIPETLHAAMRGASSQVRGEIWRLYAAIGEEHPFRGFGLEASRFIVHTDRVDGLSPKAVELLTYGHPHNAPLQVWFELGFIGAGLLAGMLYIAMQRMDRVPTTLKPYAVASFAVLFAVACVSHGAWQAWWISVIGAAILWWRVLLRAGRC